MLAHHYPEALVWQVAVICTLSGAAIGQAVRALWRYMKRPWNADTVLRRHLEDLNQPKK